MPEIDASCAFVTDSGDVAGILRVEARANSRGDSIDRVRRVDAASGKLIRPDVLQFTRNGLEYRPLGGTPWQLFDLRGEAKAWETQANSPGEKPVVYVLKAAYGVYFLIGEEEGPGAMRRLHVQTLYMRHDDFYAEEPETFKYKQKTDFSVTERYPTFVVERILRFICFRKHSA